jgi:elongation factor P
LPLSGHRYSSQQDRDEKDGRQSQGAEHPHGRRHRIARNSGYDVEPVSINKKNMQYLYDSGTTLVFMDPKTFEQIELPKQNLEAQAPYLAPNGEVIVISYDDEILGIELPAKVALTVTECEPGVRGDTVTNGGAKDAVLETGLKIKIPLFINAGEKVIVDTTTGKYDKRG